MAARIGIAIENNEAVLPSINDEILFVPAARYRLAEYAAALVFVGLDVRGTPGRPQMFHDVTTNLKPATAVPLRRAQARRFARQTPLGRRDLLDHATLCLA